MRFAIVSPMNFIRPHAAARLLTLHCGKAALFRAACFRIAQNRATVRCSKHRSGDRDVRADQPYHQDNYPDRTFHGLFSLRAGPLGAETLTAPDYTVLTVGVKSFY